MADLRYQVLSDPKRRQDYDTRGRCQEGFIDAKVPVLPVVPVVPVWLGWLGWLMMVGMVGNYHGFIVIDLMMKMVNESNHLIR